MKREGERVKTKPAENPDELRGSGMDGTGDAVAGEDEGRNGYEITWTTGTRLLVPRGLRVEEVAMLVELLREAD